MFFHFHWRRQNTIFKICHSLLAEVVELVDALDSGSSGCTPVGVRVPPSAPFFFFLTSMYHAI